MTSVAQEFGIAHSIAWQPLESDRNSPQATTGSERPIFCIRSENGQMTGSGRNRKMHAVEEIAKCMQRKKSQNACSGRNRKAYAADSCIRNIAFYLEQEVAQKWFICTAIITLYAVKGYSSETPDTSLLQKHGKWTKKQ